MANAVLRVTIVCASSPIRDREPAQSGLVEQASANLLAELGSAQPILDQMN